jgi:hypothetical protein
VISSNAMRLGENDECDNAVITKFRGLLPKDPLLVDAEVYEGTTDMAIVVSMIPVCLFRVCVTIHGARQAN